jgi:hypothetical protein
MARLKERYNDEIRQQLIERFGYTRDAGPRLQKITLNMGVGEAKQDSEGPRRRHRAARDHRRAEAQRAQGAQVDRPVQGARGHARRPVGDAAPRARTSSSIA